MNKNTTSWWKWGDTTARGFVLQYPSFISYPTVHVLLLLLVSWGAPKPCIGSTSNRDVPSNPSVASCITRTERSRASLIILCATTNMQRLVLALLYCICFFLQAVHMHFIFSKICRCFHHPWSAVVLCTVLFYSMFTKLYYTTNENNHAYGWIWSIWRLQMHVMWTNQ
jgi:hypothetical protein